MKYSDAFQVGMGVSAMFLGFVSWLVIHFGGTYLAFAGYDGEAGSVLAGFLWLFLWGPLLSGLAMIPIFIVALGIGAVTAPFVMVTVNGVRIVSRVRIS